MAVIASTISIHNVKRVYASSTRSMGGPITLRLTDASDNDSSVVLFLGNQLFADDLVKAINEAQEGQDQRAKDFSNVAHLDPKGAA